MKVPSYQNFNLFTWNERQIARGTIVPSLEYIVTDKKRGDAMLPVIKEYNVFKKIIQFTDNSYLRKLLVFFCDLGVILDT